MSTNTTDKTEQATSWLSKWLTSLGMSQTWANILAAATIGAAAAVYALLQTSCGTMAITASPDGTLHAEYSQSVPAVPAVGTVVEVTNEGK